MTTTKLFDNTDLDVDLLESGLYRITFFKDCHWHGEIYYNVASGEITDDEGNTLWKD